MCQVSGVRCHMSRVTCCVSPVTCHLSLTLTATATEPPPANCPIMHIRLVCQNPPKTKLIQNAKNHQNNKNLKISWGMPILAIRSSTRSLQSSGKQVVCDGMDTQTDDTRTLRLRDWINPVDRVSENYQFPLNETKLVRFIFRALLVLSTVS